MPASQSKMAKKALMCNVQVVLFLDSKIAFVFFTI